MLAAQVSEFGDLRAEISIVSEDPLPWAGGLNQNPTLHQMIAFGAQEYNRMFVCAQDACFPNFDICVVYEFACFEKVSNLVNTYFMLGNHGRISMSPAQQAKHGTRRTLYD